MDWTGHARSNYFQVKDPAAFKKWAENLGMVVRENDDKPGHYALFDDNVDHGGWPTYDPDAPDDEEFDLHWELARHLAEGQIAVLMEVGYEGLRYVTGDAIAIAWNGRNVSVDISDIYAKAEAEFGIRPPDAQF